MARKILTVFILLLLLVVLPLGSYFYLYSGLNWYKSNIEEWEDHGKLIDLSFVSHKGDTITTEQLKGKIVVADFIFTRCAGPCPKMTKNLVKVAEQFWDNENIVFISHTVDPEYDSVEVLNRYAALFPTKNKNVYYVTGSKKDIYKQALEGYKITVGDGSDGADDFIHSSKIALVDTSLVVRNYYDGLDSLSINKLITHIAIMMPKKERTDIIYEPQKEL